MGRNKETSILKLEDSNREDKVGLKPEPGAIRATSEDLLRVY